MYGGSLAESAFRGTMTLMSLPDLETAKAAWRRLYLARVLELSGGNRKRAAKLAGIDIRTAFRAVRELTPEQVERDRELVGSVLVKLGVSGSVTR